MADAYVTDAFAAAHRNSPTIRFCMFLPFAGDLMSAEIHAFSKAVNNPPKPYVVILGGAKCDDSLKIALNLLDQGVADTIVPVGVVGNLMLWPGYRLGQGNESFIQNFSDAFDSTFQDATRCIENREQILLSGSCC